MTVEPVLLARRLPPPLLAVLGGLCLAAATPPWGFWPFAFVGIVLLDQVLVGTTGIVRLGRAWILWVSLLLPSLLWMQDLTAPGYLIACIAYAGFLATGTLLAPRGVGRYVAYAGGVILAEWVRWRWPFGGVPLSNLATGQVAGPLAPMLRLGGALFVVGMTVTVGSALAAAWRRHLVMASALGAFAILVLLVAVAAPDGEPTGEFVDVALVQGGGPQGTRASETEAGIVLERHLAASQKIDPDAEIDLLLWPEDVVDVVTLTGSDEESQLRDLARQNDATFIVGVIEDEDADEFTNWAVAYGPDGDELDRYEKVARVPFGEWVPFRSLLESVAGDALPNRDAGVGTKPAVLDTPVGRLGVSISWEIFFGGRAREAVNNGGRVIVNPTNGASFRGTQVQTQQVANSRMRAIENGRWVTQIAPTGFSAVVSPDGDVLQRTAVSEREILYDTVELRTGRTLYTRVGDALALGFAAACLLIGWAIELRRESRSA
ncbi:MAG: apolipoprotein N-acyltransferase [Acidimicrobiales bacterium]|nr:apolipoprotein N-acyltransferase [Acidimicrobiales bacterium]